MGDYTGEAVAAAVAAAATEREAAAAAATNAHAIHNPASALSTINVRTHIPFSLEMHPPNFSRWRELFTCLLSKFGASRHIDGTSAPEGADPVWQAIDFAVRSLLYASISEEILSIILTLGASAHAIWMSIEGLFLDNKASRALSLEADFRHQAQGDLSILA